MNRIEIPLILLASISKKMGTEKNKNPSILINELNNKNFFLKISVRNKKYLDEMASIITKDLICLIWTYQFIITEATNELFKKVYIKSNYESINYLVQYSEKNH